ncbi:unnamed protein product [Cyprideis torosa]|uniref:Sorbitol dehydrogenase n=1 Tax=Cyprideis torosa TaxID=163714 RepID=A0A7R8ZNU7_9CRUS|nr:unnamed protein product [Cyprideis torosa]CAG0887173.1 unnamed protein product [Cyprideis torosa]
MAPNAENTGCVVYPLDRVDNLRLEPIPMPADPGPNQVRLRMSKVGICGSDVHYWKKGRIADFVITGPLLMGHESSGIIDAVGSEVKHLKPGDRVAIEPGAGCRKCTVCKNGRYNLCAEMRFLATPPTDGSLCRYFNWESDFCFKLPDHVSLEEGALLEPLSVAVHACRRGNVVIGSKVMVLGAGPIGLVNLLTAKAMGATRVLVTDVQDSRLAVAKSLGADVTLNTQGKSEEECGQLIKEAFGGEYPDRSIDCSGATSAYALGMRFTAPGGNLICVGVGPLMSNVPLVQAFVREVNIVAVFRYANCYPLALEMVASGKVNVKPLITHR